jgi:hypothetical protein
MEKIEDSVEGKDPWALFPWPQHYYSVNGEYASLFGLKRFIVFCT